MLADDRDMTEEQARTAYLNGVELCGDCQAYFGLGEWFDSLNDEGEMSPAWDACYTCGKVAPLDIHGVCIACELKAGK
jgi:NMD protein affecting ribosome stability and mRNA decay